jgi:hypothetical protein
MRRALPIALLALAVSIVHTTAQTNAGRGASGAAVPIDTDDIGGVVTSTRGPEAGVWVIAETTDLPTKMNRIVVTDDQGRYVVPDLPKATYDVWVRGYGLVDSPKVKAAPGKALNLTAVVAPDPKTAAQYYPANYWFALLTIPDKSQFPGTGPRGNGIAEGMHSQAQWIANIKTTSCTPCHALGDKATREIPQIFRGGSSVDAWDKRTNSGVDEMYAYVQRFGKARVLATLADWTDRIAAGEYPHDPPPRPHGIERNIVITQWDWANPNEYFHDSVASDKRNPTVNANGAVYGVHELSSDHMSMLDPIANRATQVTIPTIDPGLRAVPRRRGLPSAYWADEMYWNSRVITHSDVMDEKGRLWNTSRLRDARNPAWCLAGSNHPSAKLFPLDMSSGRQYSVYDPKTKTFKSLNTCFGTFHLNFAHDADNTLWTADAGVVGWINTRVWDETGDEQKAQGWAPLILDTNGNGKQDKWVEPDDPVDPTKDKRIDKSLYGVAVSPVDGTVWGNTNEFPGAAVHIIPGSNPPYTTLTEIFEVPYGRVRGAGYNPRGMDVDADGVFWTVLASGHYASFDRRKCKGPLNGPKAAAGRQCDEGWTFYPVPGPNFKGNPESAAADSNYYNWVDKYDSFGLGKNIPIATGNLSDSLLFLKDGKWITLRVPYPMGFFVKQIDGRIDDPTAGWKGKGLWTASATRTTWHLEGGKGTRPKLVKLQLRPTPLAK